MKNLNIISNEKVYFDKNNYFSENIDGSTLVDELSKYFKVKFFCRFTTDKKKNLILEKNIYLSNNVFDFIKNIILNGNYNNSYNLIISITPYTFLAFFFINFLFKKKSYVYIRSDGFKEYEIILGKKLIILYKFMYNFIISRAIIIACEKNLVSNKNYHLVNPSEISKMWLIREKKINIKSFNFLYVGRLKIEKGIFYLIDLFNNLQNSKYFLSIVGEGNIKSYLNQNIKILDYISNVDELIKIYDTHNIFILPSYTEAHPKVIDEALSRLLPVIIFEDIKHVVGDRKGIFVCKRDIGHFIRTSEYILNNYSEIVDKMKKNILPTKENFIHSLSTIISSEI